MARYEGCFIYFVSPAAQEIEQPTLTGRLWDLCQDWGYKFISHNSIIFYDKFASLIRKPQLTFVIAGSIPAAITSS
jgi:hypothetical protein